MNASALLRLVFVRSAPAAAALYAVVVVVLLGLIVSSIADLIARYDQLNGASAMLAQFEGRKGRPGHGNDAAGPGGSALVEGKTITIAGAALAQRVTGAITKLGGNVLSTQVELQGSQSKAGFISVVTSCELDQPALQALLYDLEAGLPFLFVDQLVVGAPVTVATSGEGKLRVLLTVAGQWQGTM